MQPKIISTSGQALTKDEFVVAQLAARAFRGKTGGSHLFIETNSGARAIYYPTKRLMITTPGTGHDYRLAALPNPVPFRGITASVWEHDAGAGIEAKAVSSSSEVLAQEAEGAFNMAAGYGSRFGEAAWSGGSHLDVFKINDDGSVTRDHKLNFTVPEDCIYPVPPDFPYWVVWQLVGGEWVEVPGSASGFEKRNTTVWLWRPDSKYAIFATDVTASWVTPGIGAVPTDSGYLNLAVNGVPVGLPPQPADIVAYAADWAVGQAAFRLRRKNWFKKNSDSVLASLAAGTFSLPRHWDSAIKGLAPVSDHTSRPILMEATFEDIVKIDTPASVVPAQVGEKLTERTVTFRYTVEAKQPDGSMRTEERQQVIVGTRKETVTIHRKEGFPLRWVQRHEYVDWYLDESESGYFGWTKLNRVWRPLAWRHQLALDGRFYDPDEPNAGMGLLWNGVVDGYMPGAFKEMWFADSAYFADSYLNFPYYLPWYAGYEPPVPQFANTLSGSAPQFVLDYRKAVPIRYNADAPGNTSWNDSALQDGQIIKLILFGPAGKGIFGEWDDGTVAGYPADTAIDLFGTASFTYKEGVFTLKSWKPCKDADGTDLPLKDGVPTPKTIDLGGLTVPQTTGYGGLAQPTMNCIVRYEGLAWPDVKKAAKDHVKTIREGDVEAEEDALLFKTVLDALA